MELFDLTIHELHAKLKTRAVSAVEATKAMLARINEQARQLEHARPSSKDT